MGVDVLFDSYIPRGGEGYQLNNKLNFGLIFSNDIVEHIFLSIQDRTCLTSLRNFKTSINAISLVQLNHYNSSSKKITRCYHLYNTKSNIYNIFFRLGFLRECWDIKIIVTRFNVQFGKVAMTIKLYMVTKKSLQMFHQMKVENDFQ